MEFFGYIAAMLIGISLGLIGGGGSILTVPILVYLLAIEPVLATAYSLFVVGFASLFGAISKYKAGLVSVKTAVVFGIPSIVAVYLTRLYLVPNIPQNILTVGDFVLTKSIAIMLFFALIMLLAAYSMLKKKKEDTGNTDINNLKFNYPLILVEGGVVGVLTGLVGAGGGFLIIPALVLFAKLPMKLAVGTSLFIIAVKSLIGFLGDIQAGRGIDWQFLLIFTAMAVVGIFIGNYLTKFISGAKLKMAFGWFVVIMALYIIFKEIF